MDKRIPFCPGKESLDLNLRYGTRLLVENDICEIVTYVLLEQEQWFEPEVEFLSKVVEHGDHFADIGANVGIYATVLAQAAGGIGRGLAIEPHPRAAKLLRRNLDRMASAPVSMHEVAVSHQSGTQSFSSGSSSETSRLVDGGGEFEVAVDTIDSLVRAASWHRFDFLKLDVEGSEVSAIVGASETLTKLDPIVMVEIVNDGKLSLDALVALQRLGYAPFHLVPGLQALVPFEFSMWSGNLNVLALKPDRAARLAARGFLLDANEGNSALDNSVISAGWIDRMAPVQNNAKTAKHWRNAYGQPRSHAYLHGISDLLAARHKSRSLTARAARLARARVRLEEAALDFPSPGRLATLLTCLAMQGDLLALRKTLRPLIDALIGGQIDFTPDEPVLPPLPMFERHCLGSNSAAWLQALLCQFAFEAYDFSTLYMTHGTLQLIERLDHLGYQDAAIERRRQLCRMTLGLQKYVDLGKEFGSTSSNFLNADLWRGTHD